MILRRLTRALLGLGVAVWVVTVAPQLFAIEVLMEDDFKEQPEQRWRFVSDQVMGGVSVGSLVFERSGDTVVAHMRGNVSTQNNGGFIQFRRTIAAPRKAAGVIVRVRGNDQAYFLHMRTRGTVLPWQYYQATFRAESEWQTLKIPLNQFRGSSQWLSERIAPATVRSIGVVAFGREHRADIEVSMIGFYQ